MGIGWGVRIPLWIPILVITFMQNKVKAQYEDQQANYDDYNYVQQGQDYFSVPVTKPQEVTIIQPLRTTLPVKPGNPAHNGRVCSTWGNFHFKTFDGDIFHFPGLCNYVFASHCKSAYEDFNIQIRRTVLESSPVISHISLKLDGSVIELTSDSIVVNGNPIQLPFSQSGILIERSSGYLKITAKMGLVFMWNQLDGLLVELDKKYANQTCGLCGDFNGIPIYNEFTSNNIKLTDVQFGNMQKMDGPTEQCEDPTSSSLSNCSNEFSAICQRVLTGEAFVSCNALVDIQDYIDSCVQDLCRCDESMRDFCICNTFAEYSRQCAHAGGQPLNWRTKELCNKTCPYNMQHEECGSPCANTCTNPERSALCEDHCTDGCVCPPGTVSDDINSSGCVPLSECHCTYKGETYSPGASFASQCTSCTCTGGQWSCVSLSCPGTCSIEGGSHISTFDEKRYSFFGDCSYILTKLCDSDAFTVLGEVRKCGLTDTETCLKGVAISIGGGQTIAVIKPSGSVFVNTIYTQLPISAANVTIFRPSSFFINVQTNFGLQVQIQLVPIMQLFVNLDPSHKGQTCGLCGNFNNIQADDFKVTSGVVEGTAAAFANSWKIQADCPNVKNIFENPCTLSIENEKYAQHWCGLLTDTQGPFAECHSTVNPDVYHTNCMFDTCNCEKSEDCMCAALSTYVRACAAKGVLLNGWRTNVCTITSCPKSLTYSYIVNSCQPTCRSLSEPDVTCNIKFTPVDGCTCANGTYMDENGKCVPATSCPCYYKGSVLPSGEVVHDNGVICSCTHGKLDCVRVKPEPVCAAPMVYFDCSNVTAGTIGSECQKSCQTLDMGCYSTQCISGCMCPNDLVSDGKGGCVAAGECPCVHNEASYNPGETIKVNCNTCTCKNRMWQCTNEPCLATCSVYGDGHYITFDGKRFSFSGDCEYTLVQDYCGKNSTSLGTFRVITENIPCGTTGTTCSKAIKVFLGNYELVLSDGKFEVIEKVRGGEVPYKVRYMGIYMVIDTDNGLILMWDKKTSIFIKLSPDFKGQVCGLCGNYDGNGINDFTTRSQSVVGDVLEFGNSWKVSPTCPDAKSNKDPCTANPYRNSWAQKQCSIINSKVFAACHSQVEPNEYYEACVTDACACDTGGDCECFCTAVASYAQACNEAGICVAWRTPSICPLFCDYYNPQGECEWHYKPCGSPCMKTCRNLSGKCLHELQGLEGCYPKCPENKPYFDEDDMECVDHCGCYDTKGKYYKPGTPIRSEENCQSCECTMNGIKCEYDEDECHCTYDGKQYEYEDVIYDTTDGIGGCIIATCGHNGTIDRKVYACSTPLTTTPFSFSSSTPISTTTVTPTTSVCVREVCQWSQWYDVSYPGSGINDGDFDTFDNLRAKGYKVCKAPKAVECRSEKFPDTPLNELEQKVECSTTMGLICYNKDQHQMICDNFQIKILCCSFVPCEYTTPATTPPAETTTPITKTTTPETTVTSISSTTTALPTTTEPKTTTLSTSSMTSKTPSTTPVTETTSVSTSTLRTTAPSTTIPETTASPSTETVYTTGEITSITPCKPKCKWSEWHDVHLPSLDNKGDSETYDDIRAAGKVICSKPENIECRAEKFPEKSIDNIGQIVQCNVSFGLVCRNEDQEEELQMCYNYQIKVFCCDDFSHCPSTSTTTETTTTAGTTIVSTETSTQTPTTTETTTSTVRTTPSTTTTTETTTKEVKTTTLLTTTPIETTTIITTPFTTTTTETTTTPGTPIVSTETSTLTPTTTETTSTIGTTHSSITSIETTTVTTTPFTATTTQTTTTTGTTTMTTPQTTTTIPTTIPITSTPIPDTFTTTTTSPTITQTTTTEFTTIVSTTNTPATTETTTAATTTPFSTTKPTSSITVTTTPAITTISETTTAVTTVPLTPDDCIKELCEWSQWYDISYPGSAINDGDFDTFKNIRAKGYKVCKAPKAVECRAERFPNTPLNELEQNVICSKTEGLICYNKDQLPPICYNYQIKIECCRNVIVSCLTTTPATTTTVTTIPATTQIVTTTPGTTPIVTTTPPIPTTTPTITPIGTTTTATTPIVTTISPTTTTVTTIPTTTEIVTTTPGTTPIVTTTPPIPTTTPTNTPIGTTTTATTPILTTTTATTRVTTTPATTPIETTTSTTIPIGPMTTATTMTVTTTPATTTVTTTPTTTSIETTTPPTTPIVTTTPATTTIVTTSTTATTKKIITQIKTTTKAQTAPIHVETTKEMHSTTKETTLLSKTTPERTPVTTSTISTTLPTTTSLETTNSETTRSGTTTGTTTLPTTEIPTTLPTSTTTGTTTSSTTVCEPTCTWSKWFNVDFPSSGPKEGDIETYKNIRAAGEIFCGKPASIQCRAESYPEISIDEVGQVVQCDVNLGLVCKNEDQIGKYKMCFNYEVRVFCCEENVNCPVTTSILSTMPTRVTTPTISSTQTGTTEVTMTTTHCFCQIEDAVYASGEMIYNEIDKDGCNFYAICSKTCSVERFKGPCKSTTPATITTPTTSTSIPTTTPTTTVSSTTKIECPDAKPPRKTGETWKISNCTTATCEGNNKVVIQKVKCPHVKRITCANGYPPVKVFSEDGCCYHYECECVCSGWGDPHYITFDGTYYTFLDNCTYTLVKQITPKYDNFRVDIDNYFCDAEDGLSCPQSIIVYYKYTVVVLTRELYNGVMANKIIFNKTVVNPGFQKDGISIYMLGINMVVEIPEIGATITFSGLIFSVKLPFSKFGNNTEGQCGTCTNIKTDDCRLPSGKIIPSCTQMAPHWKVDDGKKQYCVGTPTPPPGPSTPTPAPSCPPSALCKIILSEVFEECHKVIPPQDFYKGCVFDACHMTNTSMQCSGLEIYATLCATRDVCVDWRGETKGKCPYNCPVGKVYKPCGPLNPATCDPRAVQHNSTGLTEGCFCPEGKFLFNANSGVCIPDCDICIGTDGLPKLPGDQWKSNCQDCVCDKYTLTVQCTKRPCKPLPPVSCDDPGFAPVQSLTQEDPCCVQTECRCDTSKCPESVASCQPGYELIPEVLIGNCCTIFTCKLIPGCVTNGTFYMPGAVIPKGTCEKCTCSAKVQPDSQRNIVDCQPIPCDTECPVGYEYKMKTGQCCGDCVPKACVLKMEDNTVHVLQAGKVWHEPGDNCTFYKCEQIEDQFIPVTVRKVCPPMYPENCDPADVMLSQDGCCKTCPLPRKTCGLHNTTTVISHNECSSSVPVELTYCEGNCDTSSMYSLEANVMQHKCKCCQEVKTSKRQVTLNCPDGSTTDYSYIHVEQCDSFNPAHNGRVCSTWGNFHFKTFDGDIFYFPGLCNYIFASHCNAAYEDFNIQIRRAVVKNVPTINHVTMKLDGVVFEMAKNFVVVNGNRVQLPYSQSGIMAERSSMYTKVTAKMGLVFMWNEDDSILLELSDKYANYTCGLCGDFNGIPTYNEFFSNNAKLTATQFGNMQKMDGPTEVCEDPTSSSLNNCTDNFDDICHKVLTGPAFSECNALVEVSEYIKSCEQDLCRCDQSKNAFCICNTFGEYSRQCAHAGGQPLNWRTPQLCPKKCPFNMQYQECGSPCTDTCTNPERSQVCEDHCMDGCFCPPGNFFLHLGTVLDDINNAGCIPLWECSCTYNGNSYAPGTSFHAHCHSCTCNGGQWICKDIPCLGSCTVEGGSHISTYDEKRYNVHGDCTYVLSKLCENDTFAVLGELRRCGLTDTETCLKTIALSVNGGQTMIEIKHGGGVFVNWIYTQLPFSAANVTIFRPSSFFIMVETNFGLQLEIQLVPIMQAFVRLDPSFKEQTCGLCGNFNNIETDDFKAISGVVEGTAAAFANTWKTQALCHDIKNNFENPCALSVENEKYAKHWCGLLMDSTGRFANCHFTVNPAVYHTNCLFDTCNCEKSEDCMCAALSSYVRACAAKGVKLEGWRTDVCSKYTTSCPKSLSYSYNISSCQPTCRSLSEPDVTCNIRFIPVDGCTCEKGTYMDEYGKCVSASECPCYYKGSPILSREAVHEDGLVCTCAQGKLSCIGAVNQIPVCAPPMVYFDCRNVTAGTTGAECQKSCQTLDMQCYSTQCMSGCMCPSGLVSDGKGSCIAEEECPCIHNEATYKPGEEIKVDCNTCVCKNRMWKCTSEQCLGTCAIYGDGHYITFDDKRFNFNGDCEYTLVQDHCGKNSTVNGTFRVVTENIPCGSTGTTCSKSIKVFLAGYELILSEEHLEVVERENGRQMPYQVRYMGMYLVIETNNGLILMWDKKTSIFIKLSPDFKVCGLCGNYDGNGINDFTTRSQSVVGDVLEFGNSWKVSPTCPDANSTKDPCATNPYRKSWSQRQCSIINSEVFAACHSQVEPTKYYEACVTDACACDSGGDCECFCTAVAAYAQACSEFGVCVAWRTPSICPMFCDYYNPEGGCEWHYKPCGAPCMKTCRNPSGRCLHKLPGLEGCYPNCPANKPYFNEDEMTCVDNCGCYDAEGNYHKPGVSFYSRDNCQSCHSTSCFTACYCYYEEHKYNYKDVIYNTTDGIGGCLSATCDINGTITRKFFECSGITTTTPFTFSTVLPTRTTTTAPVTTVCVHNVCQWSEWYDSSNPTKDSSNGDFETFENLRANGHRVCKTPSEVECRAKNNPGTTQTYLKQKLTCSKDIGLICENMDQIPPICYNYEIRILCCTYVPCEPSTSTPSVTTSGIPKVTATSLESETVSNPIASISTEGPIPFPLPNTSSVTITLIPQVSTTVSVTSTASPPTPGTSTSSPGTASLQTGTIPPVTGTRPQPSPGSTLPPLGRTTTEGTTLLSTQPTSEGSTTTLIPPVFTTVSVTSTASPPTPGTATGSAGTATLQTGTIPPVTGTRPQPSPGSTLPPLGRTTTEGTTLLSTQPTSEGSTTTLIPPVSTTVSVTSTASPPTPGTATGSAGTATLQTGTIPPLTGTRPQPSPGSTLPPLGRTTTEGTTLLSTQPTSEGSTTTLIPPVSTTVSVTSTASPPTPGTATGSAGTATLQTGTIPPVTGTRPQPSPGSTLPPLGRTTTEGTTLLSTQPTSEGSTTTLIPPVSTTVSVSSTTSPPTPGTATGSAGTRPQPSPGSTLPPLGRTTTEGTTLLSTQPTSEESTTMLIPPVSTTVSVTSTASPPTPGTATGSAGTATLQTGTIPPLTGTRPQPSPGSTLPPLGRTTTEGTTLLSTQPTSEESTTMLIPPVSTTVSVTSTASPPTPGTATGSAGTATLQTGTIPPLTGTRPQPSPGSTLPPLGRTTTEGTTLLSTQPTSEGSTTTLIPPVSTTVSVTSTASPPTPGTATGSAGTATLQTGTIPPLTGTRPQPSPGSTLPPLGRTTTEGTTLLSTQPTSEGSTTTLIPPVSTTVSVTSTASPPTPGTATGSAGTATLQTGTIPPLTGTRPQPSPGSTLPPLGRTTTEGTTLLSTQPTSEGSTTTLIPPVSTTVSVTSTASPPTPGTATGSAGTATLQTGTIPPVTGTRPQPSPGSTLPPLGRTTTEGTTLLSTQPTSEGSTTTLIPPVSTTISVTSTASPPTSGTSTGSAGTASLQTGTIPPVTGTRPQPSPGSTLPPLGRTTTEGTTLLSTQPTSEESTTMLIPPVSTTVSVTSTASPPTPGTATGSAGTATLQTGTIPPLTGTRPQPSPGSTLPPLGRTTTEGTTLLSTQPTSEGSTTTLIPPVSTTVSVASTASLPTPGTSTSSGGTASLQTGTIPHVTGTRGGMTTDSASMVKGSTITGSTMLFSTSPAQPTSQGSTSTLLSPVSTTFAVSPTLSIRTPATSTISRLTSSVSATEGPSTAYTAREKSTSFTSSRVTPCLCHVSGDFFSPGDVIYNRTDSTGCSFYALCSKRCEIERFQRPCPTTTPVSLIPSSTIPSLSTPTAISSSVPATPATSKPTPVSGCPDADPPRKMNESWMLNNCTTATCEGDNRIVLLLPPAVETITCASGLPPIKVYDEDGCNYHYECDCVCSGWNNFHYLTFDGTHYTFYDNCTYVLMKQIVPKYNFSILVDNDFCDVADGLSCPRSIIVNYNSMEIVLSSQIHQGEKNNKILVNNEPISGGFSRDGISVANGGTYMVVEIPDIKSYISFNGLTFTVKMPFSMFGHNTEGQCGTCSNDKVDECRMPNGEVISSCSEMAAAWQVQDENKPNCEGPPVPPATPTTPPVPCNSTSHLCELILSDLFAECHKILTPSIFYESCVADSCHITNESIPCFSLETYASLCSAKGVCADWRSKTQGQCPYNCPNGKVYDACGPLNPVTCNSGTVNHTSEHVAEGCFCPKDKILFNSYTDVCVSECACVGPDGMPKLPGAIWKSNCQECVCDPFSVTVQCKSLTCQTPETRMCEKEGFIPVPVLTPEDPCCPEIECRCNTSACSQAKKTCEPGYQLATILSEGDCCVNYTCGKLLCFF
ncbi:antigen KI-67 [Platysternon megacephalum]|uniref:Antigen KI-67 n=1 Tax=Platysternon megacephalum TaxID=55544 RepID=A0A4D9EIG7_9SAUR|nr:antigen KI-67 [Platysternon megacephalum]